jgi:hypothetical protein
MEYTAYDVSSMSPAPVVEKSSPQSPVAVLATKTKTMAMADTIYALIVARESAFLQRVAEDYKLDYAELAGKYLEAVPKEKKKRQVKVKLTKDGEEVRCKGVTAKKEQCSFGPLPGQCFCKRHLPKEAEAAPEAPAVPETPAEVPAEWVAEPAQVPDKLTPVPEEFEDMTQFFEDLPPLTPVKALEEPAQSPATPRNLWADMEAEQEQMLANLRAQEERDQEIDRMEQLISIEEPYEPPKSPSPVKKPARRQSLRPKKTTKK